MVNTDSAIALLHCYLVLRCKYQKRFLQKRRDHQVKMLTKTDTVRFYFIQTRNVFGESEVSESK